MSNTLSKLKEVIINEHNEDDASGQSQSNTPRKLKFCLVGTHIQQYTGYSKVTYEMVKKISTLDNIEMYHFGFQRAPAKPDYRPYPENVNAFDAASAENPKEKGFGFNVFRKYIEDIQPDIILIYNDIGVITQFIMQLNGMKKTFKLWIYYDQVYEYTHPRMINIINKFCDKVFFFTEGWKKYGQSQGIVKDSAVILHGLNSSMFYQMPKEEISLYRKKLGIDEKAFVIFNLNRNTSRKRYDILAIAFAEFVYRHQDDDNLFLLVSTNPDGKQSGWSFIDIYHEELRRRGILNKKNIDKLKIVGNHMRHTDNDINILYNITDVGINTADGEGYGLCNFEHAATGRPQIVGNFGGFTEFFHKTNTYMIDSKYEYYMPSGRDGLGGRSKVLDPIDVADGMDFYYLHPDMRERHGQSVKERVLTYTWERALTELVSSLHSEYNMKFSENIIVIKSNSNGETQNGFPTNIDDEENAVI